MVLDTVKTKMRLAKNSTAEAVVAAGSVVKQGFTTITHKGYAASLKTPLFEEAAPLMENPASGEACAERVDVEAKQKKNTSAGHAVRLVKSTSGKVATTGAAVAGVVLKKLNSMWRLPGTRVNSECVEQLIGMGFARKDITSALRTLGTDDLNTVVTFLCQDPVEQMLNMGFARDDIERAVQLTGTAQVGSVVAFLCHEPLPMSRERRQRIAHGVARRLVEVEFDEDEEVKLAVALSQFEAEVSACNGGDLPDNSQFKAFQWWDTDPTSTDLLSVSMQEIPRSENDVSLRVGPLADARNSVHLRPSVGTWMLPQPRPKNLRSISV